MIIAALVNVVTETAPPVVGLTQDRFDLIMALIQGLGTVFGVGVAIVIACLAWIALGHDR